MHWTAERDQARDKAWESMTAARDAMCASYDDIVLAMPDDVGEARTCELVICARVIARALPSDPRTEVERKAVKMLSESADTAIAVCAFAGEVREDRVRENITMILNAGANG